MWTEVHQGEALEKMVTLDTASLSGERDFLQKIFCHPSNLCHRERKYATVTVVHSNIRLIMVPQKENGENHKLCPEHYPQCFMSHLGSSSNKCDDTKYDNISLGSNRIVDISITLSCDDDVAAAATTA